jgi:3-oxoacyl-[acyl-carrier protein] reductase
MDLQLRDRVYVVTGGSRGLGFAGAEALVREGARVVVSSPREASAAAAAARLAAGAADADGVAWLAADNAHAATPERLITTAEERFGRLDGALVSVGGTPPGTVATTPDDAWRGSFESVFLGAVRLVRLLGTHLTGSGSGPGTDALAGTGGSVVFVLASSVRVPLPELAISNGLFPGLAGVVKMLAEDLGPSGIRINGILPVRIATERVRQLDALSGDPDEVRARKSGDIPFAEVRRARGVRSSCRVPALPGRVLHHRGDDPGRRRFHPRNLNRDAARRRTSAMESRSGPR